MISPKVRLFVDAPLAAGADVPLAGTQMHYVRRVMRLGTDAEVALFNGRDGEWRARVAPAGRDGCQLHVLERVRAQAPESGPVLAFAPIRRSRMEMLVEKATELGARALRPVATQRAVAGVGRPERLRAHAVEAAEQCGRMSIPEIAAPAPLAALLDDTAPLVWGERTGQRPADAFARAAGATLLVGPEGGFTDRERDALAQRAGAIPVSLGPRTLRAETAALALLALWQALAPCNVGH